MHRLLALLAALLAFVGAVPASAAPLLYTVSNANGVFASFTLDEHPAYEPLLLEDYAFFITDVAGTYFEGSTVGGLSFYDDSVGGGISIVTGNGFTLDLGGIALFTGPSKTPTLFAFGPTGFTDLGNGDFYTMSAVAAGAVPEPATWAMLMLGIAVIGAAVRRGSHRGAAALG